MKRRRKARPTGSLAELTRQVEQWRATRTKRGRMPEELWAAATVLAGTQGCYRISRALRLSYETLKRRVEATTANGREQGALLDGFVEVRGAEVGVGLSGNGPTVEVHHPGGAKVVVRLPPGAGVDLATLAAGMCGGVK